MGARSGLEELGMAIQAGREKRGLTQAALARRSRVSNGMLSQIERGKANPSFATMNKIAIALGMPLSHFLDGSGPKLDPVVRSRQQRRLVFPESGLTYQLLTPDVNRQLELLLIEVPPGTTTKARVFSHEGEEAGVLLQGTLEVHIGGAEHRLEKGDSIAFPSHVPHWYRNPGRHRAVAVWAITPPSF